MVFGGVIIHEADVALFNEVMKNWRDERRMYGELKWTKVTTQTLSRYREFVDLFFALAEKNAIHFKSVVFETARLDYRGYHGGDKALGFYKLYYQFLLHKFGRYATTDDDRLFVYLDERTTKYKLGTLKNVLNNGLKKKYGRKVNVVSAVEPRDSKKCDLMQLADVLMGAIGFHFNDRHARPGARPAKIELAEYIAEKAKLTSLRQETPWGRMQFEIWQFRLADPKKKAP